MGFILLYFFGYSPKLNKPFYNFFYIFASLAVIGIAMLIPKFKSPKIIDLIASSSLEIYAFQMIFGFKLAVIVYQFLNNALLANIIREMITLLLAPVLAKVFGPLAPISSGGATTMDTTLPIIVQSSGQRYVALSIFHGFVTDFSVPFIVTMWCMMA